MVNIAGESSKANIQRAIQRKEAAEAVLRMRTTSSHPTSAVASSIAAAEEPTASISDNSTSEPKQIGKPSLLLRQTSANEQRECFCSDPVGSDAVHDVRLACRCLIHRACLISYIRSQLNDRMQLFAAMESAGHVGIICPYARADQCQAVGKETFISLADMEELVIKLPPETGENPKELPEEALLPSEIARLKRWIQEEQGDTPNEPSTVASIASKANLEAKKKAEEKRKQIEADLMTDEMIASTTKPCPSCQFRVTHWHGHSCHHIQPSGGCPKCKVPFCYKCLQSGPVNQRARGAANSCLCGGWSNFCATSDVPNNLVLTPYPYDKVSAFQTTATEV